MISAPTGVRLAGFKTNGQPTAIAKATLCAARLNGKLNGEMNEHGPIGTLEHAAITAGALRDFQVYHFTTNPHGFFRRDAERVDQPRHLAPALLDRLPGFDAKRHGQFVKSLRETGHAMIQNGVPLVRWYPAHRRGRFNRSGNRSLDRFAVS